MIHKTSTAHMTREEWLEARKHSVGGSEIGAILGLNRFQTALTVWSNKTGRLPDAEDNEAMRQGRDLEAYVAERFCELTGKRVKRNNYIMTNDDFPHLHANVDRLVIGEHAGLECKTASAYNEDKFQTDEFPDSYYAQCVSYMAVTGLPIWYLAVLVMGRAFKVYALVRAPSEFKFKKPEWCESITKVNEEEFEAIRETVQTFWRHVETDTPPAPDGSKTDKEALGKLYKDCDADAEVMLSKDLLREYEEAKDLMNRAEERKRSAENKIKAQMGECCTGYTDGWNVTWKPQQRNTFDRKAYEAACGTIDKKYFKTSSTRVLCVKKMED